MTTKEWKVYVLGVDLINAKKIAFMAYQNGFNTLRIIAERRVKEIEVELKELDKTEFTV